MSNADSAWPRRLESAAGLVVEVNANGSIRRIEHGSVVLNLFPASEVEGGPANLYLRALGADIEWTPLLGPRSPLAFRIDAQGLRAGGVWRGVEIHLALRLAASAAAWFWLVRVANRGSAAASVDLVYAQDLALAPYGAIRMNEYYVSQYLDHVPLLHPAHGWAVATRQNLAVDGRTPWSLIGSLARAASFATDALDLHGLATRAGAPPEGLLAAALPGTRRQHEHAMAVIQDTPHSLAPGAHADLGFFGLFEPDHPAPTVAADTGAVDRAVALPEAAVSAAGVAAGERAVATLFTAEPLRCRDLDEAEVARRWSGIRRHVERDGDRMLSFFTGTRTHVVLRAKEQRVLRPHGALLRTGGRLTPDEASLTTTVWMGGVFGALLTQGHVSINRFLSTTRSYLGLQRAHGLRLFVETAQGYRLLDLPSAWEVQPDSCRWIYAHDGGLLEAELVAGTNDHVLGLRLAVREGGPRRFLLSFHVALNGDDGVEPLPVVYTRDDGGIAVRAVPDSDVGRRFPEGTFRIEPIGETVFESVGGDEVLFTDGRSRSQPFLVLTTAPAATLGVNITANLIPNTVGDDAAADRRAAGELWGGLSPVSLRPTGEAEAVARLGELLPWLGHDAIIHYLAPRGLEQYSGGGWGTRDVCQGPVELLLAVGRWQPLRELLLCVFANQNADGDWPQWFMFFARERGIRPDESHGDIVFWPLHALAEYLLAAGDASILEETVPFFAADGDEPGERGTIWAHCERALALIAARTIPGTHLVAYGHGDWNDSLQPADPSMRERLCSAWTVTLHYETLVLLARALRGLGRTQQADVLEAAAAEVRDDFGRRLIIDGEITGLAYFHPDGRMDPLLHPRDDATGIHHSLLPMIHAILADLLTPAQAAAHVALIRTHLLGADGARLFDRPPPYRGGPMTHFQRAESSSFFGREIGLMYTHAHLRYAAAMAHWGDAEAFFAALRLADPIGITDVVAAARPRQANCYYSSSDAVVADRYEAAARYDDVRAGRVAYEGGWRVYSSGAGIAFRLIHEVLLGLRRSTAHLGIDPVMPRALDGLRADVALEGRRVQVHYRIAAQGCGVRSLTLNGTPLTATPVANPYRPAGVVVALDELRRQLRPEGNEMVVDVL